MTKRIFKRNSRSLFECNFFLCYYQQEGQTCDESSCAHSNLFSVQKNCCTAYIDMVSPLNKIKKRFEKNISTMYTFIVCPNIYMCFLLDYYNFRLFFSPGRPLIKDTHE